MLLVTAIDKNYLPGLIALHNSIKANAPDHELVCMVYGDSELIEQVKSLGIGIIPNYKINANLPISDKWPEVSQAMYARLVVPQLFEGRCAWIDADCIVLKPFEPIAFNEPVAAMPNVTLGLQIDGLKKGNEIPALQAGVMLFNIPIWNKLKITEKCFKAMEEPLHYKYVVQSILSYVLQGKYHALPAKWNTYGGRQWVKSKIDAAIVMHFVGALPWEVTMVHQKIWNKYADPSHWR